MAQKAKLLEREQQIQHKILLKQQKEKFLQNQQAL
jgi:hypothetical protein